MRQDTPFRARPAASTLVQYIILRLRRLENADVVFDIITGSGVVPSALARSRGGGRELTASSKVAFRRFFFFFLWKGLQVDGRSRPRPKVGARNRQPRAA